MTVNKNRIGMELVVPIAIVLLIVGILAMATMPMTTAKPEVEIGIEIADDDWRIALGTDKTLYGLEIYAPVYAEQEITIECYDDSNQVIKEMKTVADEYGFVAFIVPLGTERVIVVQRNG